MCEFVEKVRTPLWKYLLITLLALLAVACNADKHAQDVDALNDKAYHYHYISLDSTALFAKKALAISHDYADGKVEADNNMAFVELMKMRYDDAEKRLKDVLNNTDNQLELLVANVQLMRLCQRESRNKEFYDYYWRAQRNLERITEEHASLTPRQVKRLAYADSEMKIVLSTYLYYVGQLDVSADALLSIDENEALKKDTAQLLGYFYNVATGDIFKDDNREEKLKNELDYLIRCYFLASRGGYVFWQANALQAISEQLQDSATLAFVKANHSSSIAAINIEGVGEGDLAEALARKSLSIFEEYGDTYQVAGALRTLSDCRFQHNDYHAAIAYLDQALLSDTLIHQAPDLTASIYEKLSINYSALDNKQSSDYNRNLYIDTQENTRQDRELEARAEQLDKVSTQLSVIMAVVILVIAFLVVMLCILSHKRSQNEKKYTIESFLAPLNTWREREMKATNKLEEKHEEIDEQQQIARLMLERNLHKNIEQRAKMALINSIVPFIDRMSAEIRCLLNREETEEIRTGRFGYILELIGKINDYNEVLTNWIQLRKGELTLQIESFPLQQLFDIVKRSHATYDMQGISLNVEDTNAVVKADRALTLFMINTIADNARKASQGGGEVTISAECHSEYVEIAIADKGKGMTEDELNNVFNHQPSTCKQHGFGLMNCKGIIEKYKKISQMFAVCSISAASKQGEGTTFRFRLPHGKMRILVVMVCSMASLVCQAMPDSDMTKAKMYADSAYFSNLQGTYEKTIHFSNLSRTYLNRHYKAQKANSCDTLLLIGTDEDASADIHWLSDTIDIDFYTIMDLRNETAVAALALHKWDVYNYNNKLYIRLFRELSADRSLGAYVQQMQEARYAKNIAIVVLLILLLTTIPAYYMLYYRHKMVYRMMIERINKVNKTLLANINEEEKLNEIHRLWDTDEVKKHTHTAKGIELNTIVNQIISALEASVSIKKKDDESIELANDELHRLNYENDRLHIKNNVLDNCFSALKHETMYYPSRIRQIVESDTRDINMLNEITNYYKELYTILSMQAQSQIENSLRIDSKIIGHLKSTLMKLHNNDKPTSAISEYDNEYNTYTFEYPRWQCTDEEVLNLFTPLTSNLNCLIIRQIVREIGETTKHRGCGVQAAKSNDGHLLVVIKLSKNIKL